MNIAQSLIAELDREAVSTVRILERVPVDNLDWKPHAKSMTIGQLSWHLAEIPAAVVEMLRTGERETSQSRPSLRADKTFIDVFRGNLEKVKAALAAMSDEALLKERFSFKRNGDVVASFPKIGVARTILMNHSVHHRGQLTVYLRLLDVPVPAMYGTTADESAFER
jgi:uncharacterized damage-inducible protein DinB